MANGNKAHKAKQKRTSDLTSGTSKQNKIRTFIREKAKKAVEKTKVGLKTLGWVLKHPKIAFTAVAIITTLVAKPSTSQTITGKTDDPKEVVDKEPRSTKLLKGTSQFLMRGYEAVTVPEDQMAVLGIKEFDGTEIEVVTKSPEEGVLHYFLSENWESFLLIKEPVEEGKGEVVEVNAFVPVEGGLYKPLAYTNDNFGTLLIAGTKCIIYRDGKEYGTIPLTEHFGVETLKDPKFEKDGDITWFRVSNSTGEVKINHGENGKVVRFGINQGVEIAEK